MRRAVFLSAVAVQDGPALAGDGPAGDGLCVVGGLCAGDHLLGPAGIPYRAGRHVFGVGGEVFGRQHPHAGFPGHLLPLPPWAGGADQDGPEGPVSGAPADSRRGD